MIAKRKFVFSWDNYMFRNFTMAEKLKKIASSSGQIKSPGGAKNLPA
jgi:hypothetical protein